MINFSVAILTYGKRFSFLSSVLDNLLVQELTCIYLFCNGLESQDERRIKEAYNDHRIVYLSSNRNLGSAGGYFQLLSYIYGNDTADYLLLLDDDNLVEKNFFAQVANFTLDTNELVCFSRPDRDVLMRAVSYGNPRLVLGPKNGFLGHSIFGYTEDRDTQIDGDLVAAPYGGLLIPASVYSSGLLPDQKLYLYGDDYDYTHRLCVNFGYRIRYVSDPKITDLERSFHIKKTHFRGFMNNRYSLANDQQLFFSVRNQVYLSWRDGNCRFCAFVNMVVYLPVYITQFILRGQVAKALLFLKSVYAGLLFGSSRKRIAGEDDKNF